MRPLLTLLIGLAALAGCGAPAPPPAPEAAPPITLVGEIAAAPGSSREVAGYLLVDERGAWLADRLSFGAGRPVAVGPRVWLGNPTIPPDEGLDELAGARYGVALARGALEGPGSYGPEGEASYQIVEPSITPLSPRDLTIPLLLSNPGLYEGQPVRLSGQLLASPSSTLLVEAIGPGGVPEASSLQIKVAPALSAAELDGALPPGGAVRYGPARLIGIWRQGALYPLALLPSP